MLRRIAQNPGHATTAMKAAAFSLAVVAFFGLAGTALAQSSPIDFGVQYGAAIGLTAQDPRIIVATIVRYALGLLGIILIVLLLYAGFLWMTSAGDAKKIDTAKKIITQAVIGLIIIMSAFAIASYILKGLQDAMNGNGTVNGGGNDNGNGTACIGLSATCPSGALGSGIVESHYPGRSATGIPRNTRIVVTFKSKIDPNSVVIGGATPTVAIIKSTAIATNSNAFAGKYAAGVPGADIDVVASPDGKTFTFTQKNCSGATPDLCIGSPSESVFYTVALGNGIKKTDGSAAFTGTFASGYLWEFQVSSVLDLTPPKVTAAYPVPSSVGTPRNTLIHLDFNEPIDPVSSQQIAVANGGTTIGGTVIVGAGYLSTEFRTDQPCGVNSCGETIYCLPSNATVNVNAKADGLSPNPPTGVFPPNGLTDMAGNSLDGNGNGTAQGAGIDDYKFTFSTGNNIDLVPPKIMAQAPASLTGNIPRDLQISATFSKLMSSASFTTDNARLVPGTSGAPSNYWVGIDNVSSVAGAPADESTASIGHDLFAVNQPYAAAFTSGLRDLNQNCFYPAGAMTSCTGGEPFCCNGVPTANEAQWQTRCGVTP